MYQHGVNVRLIATVVLANSKDAARPSCDSPNTSPRASRLHESDVAAWSVKTVHAPSPRHRRDAKVYGHATTAMHEMITPQPPPLPLPSPNTISCPYFSVCIFGSFSALVSRQKTEASELFRLASPSEASMPDLAFVAPVLNEHVHPGETFSVAWTSPDIERWGVGR